ncbi:MAG0490 family ComEA-like DNA-binding protein [Mesomycoplasma lagogenitalium]|uniref:Uncharacterized protein n=1 Tax=Mesomycoplasma lagogenitalium TaxID=171286 RepID=A0ABY8LSU5_9BACT|nr:hypothetical protein [Mesomycoplasma lagogenitalium]WGI36323.1 hypothetical protein QEG99_02490 [Mesomycoplasma lagogenitalium]
MPVLFIVFSNSRTNVDNLKQNQILVKVSGAVEHPSELFYKKGTKLRAILFKLKLKTSANLKNIDLDQVINEDKEIFIPFLDNYQSEIKKSFKNVNQDDLKKLKIRKNTIENILLFLNKNTEILTWEDIEKINGVGEVTLKILQENFILD